MCIVPHAEAPQELIPDRTDINLNETQRESTISGQFCAGTASGTQLNFVVACSHASESQEVEHNQMVDAQAYIQYGIRQNMVMSDEVLDSIAL